MHRRGVRARLAASSPHRWRTRSGGRAAGQDVRRHAARPGDARCLRAIRRAGLRTALLSNSWGANDYPRHLFAELFDVVVISAEVGMRKPEERIFRHAAALLGLSPAECVFIDDIEANMLAAQALGHDRVLHHDGPPVDHAAAVRAARDSAGTARAA